MMKNKKLKFALIAAMMAAPGLASAQTATPPIDVSDLATDIVGWVGTAALAGFGIFGAIAGIRYIKRAFKSGASG